MNFEYRPAADPEWQHDLVMDIVSHLEREGYTDEDDPLVTVDVEVTT